MHVGRTAAEDVEIRGTTIRRGEVVALWNASANRDEEVFAGTSPEVFDLSRSPNRHLTFGYGPHFCIGAQLARTEIKALLTRLRETVKQVEITGPVSWIPSTFISGARTLPVRLGPA
jgi:cytochrome P450